MWPNGALDNIWTHPMPMQVYALPDGTHVFMPLCYESIMPFYPNAYCVEQMPPNSCMFDGAGLHCVKKILSLRPDSVSDGRLVEA